MRKIFIQIKFLETSVKTKIKSILSISYLNKEKTIISSILNKTKEKYETLDLIGKNNSSDLSDDQNSNFKENKDQESSQYKNIDELYDYITSDNSNNARGKTIKNRYRNKKKNKNKNSKKEKIDIIIQNNESVIENEQNESQNNQDDIVETFKSMLTSNLGPDKKKIKPFITKEWIEHIDVNK